MGFDPGARKLLKERPTRAQVATILRDQAYNVFSRRIPGPQDDAAQGFAAGRKWIGPNRRLYTATSAAAGRARWMASLAPIGRAGSVAGGLLAAYAMRRVVEGYAGAGVTVVRASDGASRDVGFLADGALDALALYSFLSGTTGRVSRWWDQTGNGHHADQTDPVFRPQITPFAFVGNAPGVMFDNGVTANGTVSNQNGKIWEWLTIPTTLAAQSNSLSIVSLASFGHALRNQPIVELSADTAAGGAQPVSFGYGNSTNSIVVVCPVSTNPANPTTRALGDYHGGLTPIVSAMTGGNTNVLSIYGDDKATYSNGILGAAPLRGGTIGGTTKFNDGGGVPDYGYNVQGALLIYGAALTPAQYSDVHTALCADFGVTPQRSGTIVFNGDSITEGARALWFQSWPRQCLPLLSREMLGYNTGIGGSTMNTEASAAPMAKWLPLLSGSESVRIAVCAAASNDLKAGTLASAILANDAVWTSRIPAGVLKLCATAIPRQNLTADQEAERLAVNAARRTTFRERGFDGCIDFAADPLIATWATAQGTYNGTYLQDGTHPTTLGYSVMAGVAAETINAALAAL